MEKSLCFCFFPRLTTHLMQVASQRCPCGWTDGRLAGFGGAGRHCGCRRFHRGGVTGGSVWRGWNDKHNFVLKHYPHMLGNNSDSHWLSPKMQHRLRCKLCVLGFSMLWQPTRRFPKLWLMSPELQSCSSANHRLCDGISTGASPFSLLSL